MKDLLEKLKEAAAKATPQGPEECPEKIYIFAVDGDLILRVRTIHGDAPNSDNDYDYYRACAPKNILTLITELERLREMEREARDVLKEIIDFAFVEPIGGQDLTDYKGKARAFLSKWAAPVERGRSE